MKKTFALLSLILTFVYVEAIAQTPLNFAPDQLLVKFKNEVAIAPQGISKNISIDKELTSIKNSLQAFSIKAIDRPYINALNYPALQNIYLIKLNKAEELEDLIKKLKEDPSVEYVEKDYIVKAIEHVTNDYGQFPEDYHLKRVSAHNAWEIQKRSNGVKVAIFDSGIDFNHPDLGPNLDAVNSWDFVGNDNNPNPDNAQEKHGTHIAGIVGAVTNNNYGVASLSYGVSILCGRVLDANGKGLTSNLVAALMWAANGNYHVINMSLGGEEYSQSFNDACQYAVAHDCVVVAAVGNDNTNTLMYPAAYPNVFGVASTTSTDSRSGFSNYGSYVDVCAPGSSIYSTVPFSGFGYLSGTSMAAPLVTSLFALLKAANPTFTRADLEYRVRTTTDNIDYRNPSYVGQLGAGRINAISALYGGSYCLSNLGAYNASDLLGLGNITFNGTVQNGSNSASKDGKYSYHPTATPTALNLGTNTFETVQFRGSYTNIVVGIWIDSNNNGLFDSSEKVYQGSPNSATSTAFNVPCNTPVGRYRLRIRMTDSQANIDACSFYSMGDTKDYIVDVQASNPIAMSASSNQSGPVCAGTNVTLNFSGCTGGTMRWQDNASNVSPRVVTPTQTTVYKAECTKGGCVVDTKSIPVIIPPQGTKNAIILWEKSFGGTANDQFRNVAKTADGGYLLTGYSASGLNGNRTQLQRGAGDGMLIKVDAHGNRIWEKAFGGVNEDYLFDILPTSDNNFLIVGQSFSGVGYEKQSINKGDVDGWIIKINPNGDVIWEVSLGSTAGDYTGNVVAPTAEGGLIVVSSVGSTGPASVAANGNRSQSLKSNSWDYWIFKIDANGQKVWDKVYGGLNQEFVGGIEKAADNSGFYIIGQTNSANGAGSDITTSARHDYDGWLLKIDNNGNKIFDKTFSGGTARSPFATADFSNESLRKIKALPDGNYLIQGFSNNHTGNEKTENSMGGLDMWLIKIAPDGTKLSDKVFGGTNNEYEGEMIILNDGSILLSSSSKSAFNVDRNDALKGTSDIWLLKLDPNLNIIWSENFGGAVGTDLSKQETIYKILNDGNDNFILAGWADEAKGDRADAFGLDDAWVMKINIPSISKPTISTNSTLVCPGESITLTVSGCTSNILWSNGATTNSIVVKPNSNDNTYKVSCITNANACIGTDSDVFRVSVSASDLNLTGTAISGNKQAKNTIISHETINNAVNVTYKAGKSILLDKNQSFEAKAGSVFKAEIAACNLEQGMVGYYPFNGNVQDVSGNARHGVLTEALFTKDRFGKPASALSFDGINDKVSLNYTYSGYQELTVSAWINVKDLANDWQSILSANGSEFSYFQLHQGSGAILGVYTSATQNAVSNSYVQMSSVIPYNPKNNWAHVLIKIKSGDSKFFLNGQVISTSTQIFNYITATNLLKIGNGFGDGRYFKGEIDDLRIYNKALGDAEVIALYKSEAPNPSLSAGLFANYKFDGNANDFSGKGNNGAINGGATFTTDRFGQANKALNFDGIDDYVSVLNNPSLSGFNEITMSAWLNHSQLSGTLGSIIAKWYQETGKDTYITSVTSNKVYGTTNNILSGQPLESTNPVPQNTWFQLTFTHDSSGDKLFVNGQILAANALSGNVIYSIPNLLIGTDSNLGTLWRFYKGKMDDVRLYNRALSPLEVIQLYDLEKP